MKAATLIRKWRREAKRLATLSRPFYSVEDVIAGRQQARVFEKCADDLAASTKAGITGEEPQG